MEELLCKLILKQELCVLAAEEKHLGPFCIQWEAIHATDKEKKITLKDGTKTSIFKMLLKGK